MSVEAGGEYHRTIQTDKPSCLTKSLHKAGLCLLIGGALAGMLLLGMPVPQASPKDIVSSAALGLALQDTIVLADSNEDEGVNSLISKNDFGFSSNALCTEDRTIMKDAIAHGKYGLFFDFDGDLVPVSTGKPEKPAHKKIIQDAFRKHGDHMWIVTAQAISHIDAAMGGWKAPNVAGIKGFQLRFRGQEQPEPSGTKNCLELYNIIRGMLPSGMTLTKKANYAFSVKFNNQPSSSVNIIKTQMNAWAANQNAQIGSLYWQIDDTPGYYDIVPSTMNKADAVSRACNIAGFNVKQYALLAAGDGSTDEPMMELAQKSNDSKYGDKKHGVALAVNRPNFTHATSRSSNHRGVVAALDWLNSKVAPASSSSNTTGSSTLTNRQIRNRKR